MGAWVMDRIYIYIYIYVCIALDPFVEPISRVQKMGSRTISSNQVPQMGSKAPSAIPAQIALALVPGVGHGYWLFLAPVPIPLYAIYYIILR